MFKGFKLSSLRGFTVSNLRLAQKKSHISSQFRTEKKPLFDRYNNTKRTYATYIRFGNRTSTGGVLGMIQDLEPTTRFRLKWALILFGLYVVTHIEQAPITKRWRLMLFPNLVESWISKSNYRALRNEFGNQILPANHPETLYVKRVFSRIIKAASDFVDPETGEHSNLFASMKDGKLEAVEWEIMVIDDSNRPMPNAMLLGNGKVIVFRSILGICKNEDGLATVLGHELGHQLQHHILEGLSGHPFSVLVGLLGYSAGLEDVSNILYTLLFDRPASRGMETEADYIGLMLMARACFNPYESPKLWERMDQFQKRSGGGIPEFLSTHPANDNRRKALTNWLPRALHIKELTDCHELYKPFRTMTMGRNLF